MDSISEKTRITVPVLIMILGFSFWLSGVFFQGIANGREIDDLKRRQEAVTKMITDIEVIKSEVHEIKKKVGL